MLAILSNGQIVTPKAAEVFDQPTAYKPLLDKCKAFLHTGTIKVRSGITVIHQNFQVCIPMVMGIFRKTHLYEVVQSLPLP